MSNYIVSARKYRPATFDNVVGQSALTTTLKNSIASGRLAHAYLFCGPRGVGKTTCARIFAKTINCLHPKANGDACEECESCKAFNEQRSYNIHELDAASNNSVDDIRQLIEQVNIPPQVGKYKVFIVDEVHMLSTAAFNAFLKTLEEPPAHAIFILATTEKHKLLPTILSRCQIYDFNRMTIQDIVGHLERVAKEENIQYETAALNVIAQKADGGMRDALSIFDQVASFCQGHITYQQTIADLNVLDYEYYFKLVDYFLEGKITEIMLTLNDILSKGFEGSHFIGGLNNHLRNLLVSRDPQTVTLIEASEDVRQRYAQQAQRCQPKFLFAAIRKCTDCDLNYKISQNKRLLVELTLIEIAQLATDEDPSSGLGPTKILKPLFQRAAASKAAQTAPAAPQTGQPRQQGTATADTLKTQQQQPAKLPDTLINRLQAPANTGHGRNSGAFQPIRINTQPQPAGQTAATAARVATAAEKIPSADALPLTQENVIIAWRTYAQQLPHDDATLAVRMENSHPTLLDDNETLELKVTNPLVEKLFMKVTNDITSFMRAKFANQQLKLRVTQTEAEPQKRVYSKYEQLSAMCAQNPVLKLLKEEFDLELN